MILLWPGSRAIWSLKLAGFVPAAVSRRDDALKAINLVTSLMSESVLDGGSQFKAGSHIKIEEAKSEPIDEGVDETEVEELLEGDIRLKEAERVKDQEENAPKKKKTPLKN